MRGPLIPAMNDADHEEFVTMHVISKNLQSIRSDRRLEDLISEIGLCNFDLMCLQECWRVDAEECFETDRGDLIYLSGGDRYKGVGIVVSALFRKKIEWAKKSRGFLWTQKNLGVFSKPSKTSIYRSLFAILLRTWFWLPCNCNSPVCLWDFFKR